MAEESAVKVCVRVRPAIRREESHPSERTEPDQIFWKANKKIIHQLDDGNSPKSFSFDRVFTAEETTDQLYQDIAKPLVVSTVGGYNGTIFAYGQTASGKTFTMMGTNHIPGVIPMAIDDVFQTIKKCPKKEFLLRVSYMEIYNETVTDLLVDSWKRKPLEVRETTNKNIYVADLTEELVTSPAQALAWIRKGEKNRHYGMTKMNQRSSRSHTIFRMILESRERSDLSSGENADGAIIVSHLNLVDLAGSERASQTGAEGTRLKEGCNINRSLFTLGQVMMKLSDESPSGFINYRDSKLTRILQNSLGGNAKTVILCTITPTFLDETLRTLQFASTAKKMKNDPHVTEVSDDGALLKRYRNEIVDLKKRLHEVSLVTQTTATEREVLSQLLQEKEQLQGEQEDRIRNLTKLLVTSTNLSRVPKVPKRRVTWGGKIAPPSTREDVQSDLSFVCSVNQRKVSCLTEVEDEEFDSHWEIPEEALDDTNSSGDFVTLRSFGNRSFERVSELELQLQALDQENQQALAQIQAMEKEAADVDLKFKSEAQQKADATDKIKLLELSVAELNKQLEEQRSNRQSEFNKQIGRDFEETVHLCEILATEKEMLASERDYLKQELGIFMEQTQILEKENAALSQELEENRELEEFKYLEKKFGKELEWEFQDEIGSLKKVIEAQGIQCLEFKKNLETVSEELMKKTKMADDLQNMVGKDLTQEVAKLRRSLEDSEGLGRETKKEWAFLRSENIALEEMKKTLTVSHEKMEAEVHSLRFQLESEKSNFRKMQMDLQKELNDVFKENTKLTTLLDGKVPRNMMDNVELERTVINLKKELTASQEAEEVLKAQLEELRSLQSLTNEGNNLDKIAAEEMEKRESDVAVLTAERDQLRMDLQENIDMMIENQADLRNAHGKIVALKQRLKQLESSQTPNLGKPIDGMTAEIETLQTQIQKLSKDLESVVTDRDHVQSKMEKLVCQVTSLSEERNQLQNQLERAALTMKCACVQAEKNVLVAEKSSDVLEKLTFREMSLNEEHPVLQKTMEILRQEKNELAAKLKDVTATYEAEKMHFLEKIDLTEAERDALLAENENGRCLTEELEELTCKVNSASGDRAELQETLEILSQEKNELAARLEHLTGTYQAEKMHLLEKIELAQAEKDALLAENENRQRLTEELEKLTCKVNSLSGERAELQEILEILSQEKNELAARLEHLTGTYQAEKMHFLEKIELAQAEKNALLPECESRWSSAEELEKLTCKVNSLSGERAQLQEILEILSQEKKELAAKLEDVTGTYQAEKMHLLEKIELAQAEKNALLAERESRLSSAEELEKLTCKVNSLSGERAQLQETLEILTEEKNQLTTKLEDMTETHEAKKVHLVELLALAEAERDALLAEKERRLSTAEELEELTHKVNSLCVERAQLQGTLEILNQEKSELSVKLEDMTGTYEAEKINLFEKVALAEAERDARLAEKENECKNSAEKLQKLTSQLMFLSGERAQMQEILEEHERDKKQIKVELQDKMSMVQQLEEQVKLLKKNQSEVQAEANTSQQLLTEAKATISVLNQKLKRSDQNMTDSKVTASSRLHDSTVQLEELFGRFQQFVDACIDSQHEVKEEQAEYFLNDKHSFPQATYIAHNMVCGLGHKNFMTLSTIIDALLKKAQLYTINFRQLVRCDLSSFEEWRLQDMLQCRSQAPTYTLKDLDCCSGRGNRLCELIQKRQFCVQKMDSILKKLRKSLDSYRNEHSADVREKARFSKQVQDEYSRSPVVASRLTSLFRVEADSRSVVSQNRTIILKGILDDWQVEDQELRQLNAQAQRQLQEDKDKRVTLQHMLEETPSSEPSLLSNNQQRDLLRQSEENIKWKQEEEAEIKANSCVTDHSVAIQQLKMELLASQAQVGQLENTIKTLKQLQESEKSESPFSAELEKVKMELFKMKLELNAASEKHRQEIQKMTIVLNVKEESLRKLKETLRTQHQGDESFLQGEELCDRLLNPRGVVNKTSRGLRENNLEEEVKHLQIKIGHLENVISSQQADLAKWKNRAIKLKLKANRDFKSSPPHTPTKQGPCVYPDTLLQSPRKFSVVPQKLQGTPIVLQDSPKIPLIDSPKSQFFDFASNADLLARTCPTQFFDNSSLGITADTKLDENCSQPPRQDCITQ